MTASAAPEDRLEGRLEDVRLVTGNGRYVDDVSLPGQAYMGLVRSPFAHARITRIDLSGLSASADFIAALTGQDLVDAGIQPVAQNPWPFQKRAIRYQLAVGKVRFVGEPVVAVLSRRRESVEDLVEQVRVEYDPLPVVATVEQAKEGAVKVYDDWEDNVSQSAESKTGDVDAALKGAAFVVEAREGIMRQTAVAIEPRSVLAQYDAERDEFQVLATTQSVHSLQGHLSSEFKLPRERFHVRVMDMGGGFGSKGGPSYPEPLLACLFSKRTGLPVKWTGTRSEELLETSTGRDEYCSVTIGCDARGRVVALRGRIECDVGVTGTQVHMPQMSMQIMKGPYGVENVDLEVVAYATNKLPIGPLRGAGVPEGCYFIERAMEMLARKAGIDPVEFRRRNLLPSAAHGAQEYHRLIDVLVASARYGELVRWRDGVNARFREGSSPVVAGLGVSLRGGDESEGGGGRPQQGARGAGGSGGGAGRWTGGGAGASGGGSGNPWASQQTQRPGGGAAGGGGGGGPQRIGFTTETAKVVLDADGVVTVYTGSSPHGQGEETTFAQLASQELSTPVHRVHVVWGDTGLIPQGIGTFGSRSAAIGGSAVVEASRKLRASVLDEASKVLGVAWERLELKGGVVGARPESGRADAIGLGELVSKMGVSELSAEAAYTISSMSYSSGFHLCAVTVDTELGSVKVERYFVAEDCGRMINRSIVEGQLHGGIVHAIGGSLYERVVHDADGNLLSGTLMDYNIPGAMDSPDIVIFHMETPAEGALDGAKGVGESGTIAAYAAVMNAVNDALGNAREGAEVNIAPATPDAVFDALMGGRGRA